MTFRYVTVRLSQIPGQYRHSRRCIWTGARRVGMRPQMISPR